MLYVQWVDGQDHSLPSRNPKLLRAEELYTLADSQSEITVGLVQVNLLHDTAQSVTRVLLPAGLTVRIPLSL